MNGADGLAVKSRVEMAERKEDGHDAVLNGHADANDEPIHAEVHPLTAFSGAYRIVVDDFREQDIQEHHESGYGNAEQGSRDNDHDGIVIEQK